MLDAASPTSGHPRPMERERSHSVSEAFRAKLIYLEPEDQYFVSHRLLLAQAAKAAGYEVTVVTRCGTAARTIREAGLKVINFAMQRRGLSPLGLLREAWQLAAIYRSERPQLVHHVTLRSVVVGALAARLAGVSAVVAALTGLGYLFTAGREGHWARRLLEKALPWILRPAHVIVQNPADRALLENLGVPRARLRLIPGSGVDVAAFRPVRRAPNPTPVVLMPSRMLWDKGVGEFAEAARALRGRGRFVLAGDTDAGNPSAVPVETLRTWQQEGVIEWWGRQEDMPAVLAKVDIVCLPSYYREGMPKALLEAMACGLPCVTADAPGCRDCVADGDNGLLVPVRDVKALVQAIGRLLDDPPLRMRLGERGRQRAVEEFSSARVIDATLAVYRELCPP